MLAIILSKAIYGTFRAYNSPFAGIHYHEMCCSQGSFCGTSCVCVCAPQRNCRCSRGSALCHDILYKRIFVSLRAPQKASRWGVQNQHVWYFLFPTEQHRAPASTAPITSFHAGVYRREGMFQVLGRGQLDRDARGAVANRATAARTESAVLTRGLL